MIYHTDYVLEENGQNCQHRQFVPVSSLVECITHVGLFKAYYPSLKFKKVIAEPNSPKGCYAHVKDGSSFGIYFNTHSFGTYDDHSRSLCKAPTGNKQKYYTSSTRFM